VSSRGGFHICRECLLHPDHAFPHLGDSGGEICLRTSKIHALIRLASVLALRPARAANQGKAQAARPSIGHCNLPVNQHRLTLTFGIRPVRMNACSPFTKRWEEITGARRRPECRYHTIRKPFHDRMLRPEIVQRRPSVLLFLCLPGQLDFLDNPFLVGAQLVEMAWIADLQGQRDFQLSFKSSGEVSANVWLLSSKAGRKLRQHEKAQVMPSWRTRNRRLSHPCRRH